MKKAAPGRAASGSSGELDRVFSSCSPPAPQVSPQAVICLGTNRTRRLLLIAQRQLWCQERCPYRPPDRRACIWCPMPPGRRR
jgi:hypothetical protein